MKDIPDKVFEHIDEQVELVAYAANEIFEKLLNYGWTPTQVSNSVKGLAEGGFFGTISYQPPVPLRPEDRYIDLDPL